MTTNQLKYCHYTPIKNSNLSNSIHSPYQKFQPNRIKSFKIKIKQRLVYIVEIYYFKEYAFIKFHPKLHENNINKYQIIDMGMNVENIKKLLNTCCKIILDEIDKSEHADMIYAFFGQWYDKDNLKERLVSKRYNLYKKQVTTFFSVENFSHYYLEIINFYCISPIENRQFIKQVEKLREVLANDLEFTELFMTEKAKDQYL